MKQSKLASLVEASINTAFGFVVSFAVWPLVAAVTGVTYSTGQHWAITGIFTVVSVARGYAVRRFFAGGFHLLALRIAGLRGCQHETTVKLSSQALKICGDCGARIPWELKPDQPPVVTNNRDKRK